MLRGDETNIEEGIEITSEKHCLNSAGQIIVFDYIPKSEDFLKRFLTVMINEGFFKKDVVVYKK